MGFWGFGFTGFRDSGFGTISVLRVRRFLVQGFRVFPGLRSRNSDEPDEVSGSECFDWSARFGIEGSRVDSLQLGHARFFETCSCHTYNPAAKYPMYPSGSTSL